MAGSGRKSKGKKRDKDRNRSKDPNDDNDRRSQSLQISRSESSMSISSSAGRRSRRGSSFSKKRRRKNDLPEETNSLSDLALSRLGSMSKFESLTSTSATSALGLGTPSFLKGVSPAHAKIYCIGTCAFILVLLAVIIGIGTTIYFLNIDKELERCRETIKFINDSKKVGTNCRECTEQSDQSCADCCRQIYENFHSPLEGPTCTRECALRGCNSTGPGFPQGSSNGTVFGVYCSSCLPKDSRICALSCCQLYFDKDNDAITYNLCESKCNGTAGTNVTG